MGMKRNTIGFYQKVLSWLEELSRQWTAEAKASIVAYEKRLDRRQQAGKPEELPGSWRYIKNVDEGL